MILQGKINIKNTQMWVLCSQNYFVFGTYVCTWKKKSCQTPEIHDPILILGHSGVGMELDHKVHILILITN